MPSFTARPGKPALSKHALGHWGIGALDSRLRCSILRLDGSG